nr:4-alpha-glucanotransferase [Lachnospiraceae bacterium]
MAERKSGILMSVSSLPSPYGIGTLGKAAYEYVDFLVKAGQSYWQILPLGPTSYGDSPYQSFSTYAGNPYFVDPDMLVADGLVKKKSLTSLNWGEDPLNVDYGLLWENRYKILREAFESAKKKDAAENIMQDFYEFREQNTSWLENYSLFMALKNHFNNVSWIEWPDEDIRLHKYEAVERYKAELAEDVEFYSFIQFLFFKQWKELKQYASEAGIKIIGDIPIYVALDSADVWAEPHWFKLDEKNLPVEVAGVPPDYFTEDGQLWGNPLYEWDKMREDGFGWWIRRIDGASRLYDVIRIDHFRGFESFWAVPYGEKTARNGKWVKGPGVDLINVLKG